MKKTFLTAEWRNLIMANYVIDPAVLSPYLPNKTVLDVYNGNVYLSLVGFMFANTRLLGIKVPFHVNFEEVNLRFYIRYNDNGTWKRGTVFIKEIVPRSAISFVANNLYNEKYSTMPMKHFYYETPSDISLGYQWKYRKKWNRLEATIDRKEAPMVSGSEEEFIAEHYWGYSKYSHETTYEYEVVHPAWKVYTVKQFLVDVDFTALYGNDFLMLQSQQPTSVFVAKGSPVSILHKTVL